MNQKIDKAYLEKSIGALEDCKKRIRKSTYQDTPNEYVIHRVVEIDQMITEIQGMYLYYLKFGLWK